tara:strand:- start:62 stop:466 length:405 start_codon:yes stop_codon:yes gene_type:complete
MTAAVCIKAILRTALLKPAWIRSKIARVGSQDVHRSSKCITSVLDGTLTADELETVHGKSIHGVPVLDGTAAVGAIVDPDSIDEEKVLSPCESPYEGAAVTVSGFLDHDPGSIGKRFRHCTESLLAKLFRCYDP